MRDPEVSLPHPGPGGFIILGALKNPPLKGICSEDNLRTSIQTLNVHSPLIQQFHGQLYILQNIFKQVQYSVVFYGEKKRMKTKTVTLHKYGILWSLKRTECAHQERDPNYVLNLVYLQKPFCKLKFSIAMHHEKCYSWLIVGIEMEMEMVGHFYLLPYLLRWCMTSSSWAHCIL